MCFRKKKGATMSVPNQFKVCEENEEFLSNLTGGRFVALCSGWWLAHPKKGSIQLLRGDILFSDYDTLVDGDWITIYTAAGFRELKGDKE